MFINKHLISFISGHGMRIMRTCVLQLMLTALATIVSLFTAFAVRMIQGETHILFYHHLWQVLLAIAVLTGIRFVLSKIKLTASAETAARSGLYLVDDGPARSFFF